MSRQNPTPLEAHSGSSPSMENKIPTWTREQQNKIKEVQIKQNFMDQKIVEFKYILYLSEGDIENVSVDSSTKGKEKTKEDKAYFQMKSRWNLRI